MSNRRLACSTLVIIATVVVSTTAQALAFRTYLASDGHDLNACSLLAPCRLLPAALAAVADGGEIWMLDSANYNTGPVNINKSVSILAVPGAVGSVVGTGGNAINIPAGLNVALRNLVIVPVVGGAAGVDGIHLTGSSSLVVEDSVIAKMPNSGIYAGGNGSSVKIVNTTIRDSGDRGVYADIGAQFVITGSRLIANYQTGVYVLGGAGSVTQVLISDSIISNSSDGVLAFASGAGAVAQSIVTRCTINNTSSGLRSIAGSGGVASIVVSASTVANAYYGWYIGGSGAEIKTHGDNHFSQVVDHFGTMSFVGTQ
jgi:hypothetical protein